TVTTSSSTTVSSVFLSDLTPVSSVSGFGPMERDRSNGGSAAGDGGAMTLGGVVVAKGLGVHSSSAVVYALAGKFRSFVADVGVDDECGNSGSVVFQVFVDGVKVFESPKMTGASATGHVVVS